MSENSWLYAENIEYPTPEHLTAVILAGGLGMRLRAVVQNRPKVMANVAGRPFLTYVVGELLAQVSNKLLSVPDIWLILFQES